MRQIVELLPEDVKIDETLNVRPFSMLAEPTEAELAEFAEFARSIKEDGQNTPGIVRQDADGGYVLIAGHRRLQAHMLNNLGLSAGVEPAKFIAVVTEKADGNGDDFRDAFTENLRRTNPTPMDYCVLIGNIRAKFGWKGKKGTASVADYFGKSPAWITTHEKLSGLTPEQQKDVQSGKLSADAAFYVADPMNVKPELQDEVLAEAAVIQEAEGGKNTGTLKKKNIEAAAKKLNAVDPSAKKPLTRTELNSFWEEMLEGPAYGHDDGAVKQFVKYYLEKFAEGKGTVQTCNAKFAACVERAPKGTAPKKDVDGVLLPDAVGSKKKKGETAKDKDKEKA